MAFDLSPENLDCLTDYLVTQLTVEALNALLAIVVALKVALETYIALYIIPDIDKLIEELLLQLRFTDEISGFVNDIIGQIVSMKRLLPPDRLAECTGLNEMLLRIEGSTDILLSAAGFGASYTNRYNIATKIENNRDNFIQEAIDALDLLILLINQAIAQQSQAS